MKSRYSKAPNSAYNDKIFALEDLPKLDRAFVKLSNKYPFSAEALNFMLVTGARQEETLKLRRSMRTKDSKGRPIILMPGTITKSRRPRKIVVTEPVQMILDRLDFLREGEYKRFFAVPWEFPTLRTNRVKLSEAEYLHSNHTRIKNLEGCWKAIEKETGIKGSPKMFRKTNFTHCRDVLGEDDAMVLQDQLNKATPKKHYWKTSDDKRKALADKVGKIFTFPRAVND